MEEDGDENGRVDLERALDGTWDALLSNMKLVPAMVVRKVRQSNIEQEIQCSRPRVKSDPSQGFLEPVS